MNRKQLAFLGLLAVLLGGAGLMLHSRSTATWRSTTTKSDERVVTFPLNEVSHITIKAAGTELNLVRQSDVWTVKERADYPADFERVSGLIRKTWELKPVQDVKVGPSQLGRLELIEPGKGEGANSGTLLDLKSKDDKRIAALLIGKKYLKKSDYGFGDSDGFPAGRYVMAPEGANRVSLISDTLDDVDTKPERWLNHDFLKIENPKSITLTGTTPAMNWKLVRDTDSAAWKLAEAKPGEEIDSSKTSGLATVFANAGFADILAPDTKPEETGLDNPSTATIETFENFIYTLRFGKLTAENYPVRVSVTANLPKERPPAAGEKPEDKTKRDQDFQAKQKELADKLAREQKFEKRPYLIAKYTVDQVLRERSELLAEKKPEPAASPSPSPAAAASPSTTTSPVSVTTPPVSVTTPPVASPSPVIPAAAASAPASPAPKPSAAP